MRGKYSPTVSAAYVKDREWWTNYAYSNKHNREREYVQYDPEGYDSYGYDENEVDRAGNQEHEYYHNDAMDTGLEDTYDFNFKYDDALGQWGFDGTKPVSPAT